MTGRVSTTGVVERRAEDATVTRRALPHLMFGALVVAGLVVRVLTMRTTWRQPDGDQAMGILMVVRASHGHLALVFWGQNYGGTLLTWVEAPLIAIAGTKIWIFQAVDTALALVAALLLREVARRFVSRAAADVAAATFWFFPAFWLFLSSREYVFFTLSISVALAACLFVLRWFESHSQRWLWAAGYCAGLSIWCYPLASPLFAPALAVLLWTLRRDRRALVGIASTALLGMAPWLAFFALHGRAAVHLQSVSGSRVTAFRHTLTQVLPTYLVGGQKRFGVIWTLSNASPHHLILLGVGIYAATVVYTLVAVRRHEVALAACGASVLIWPFVLILGHVPIGTDTARYGMIPVPPLLILAAHLLSKVRLTPVLALGGIALTLFTVSANTSGFAVAPGCPESLTETSRFLVSQHRTDVWASYWLSAPLELCSGERVVASSVAPVRDHFAAEQAGSAPRSTFVVFPGNALDNELLTWTRTHQVAVTRTIVGDFATWEFDSRVSPEQIGLDSAF